MKKIYLLCLLYLLASSAPGQINSSYKSNFIKDGLFLLPSATLDANLNYGDSLKGFDEKKLKVELASKGVVGAEYIGYITKLKREFILSKYFSQTNLVTQIAASSKNIGNTNTINIAPCVNEGFESSNVGAYTTATAVAGWTVSSMTMNGCTHGPWSPGSSEFSIAATPITGFPGIGTIPNSPFGGTKVARLNNFINNTSKTKIATNFPVTSSNCIFQFAFAGYFQGTGNTCCDASGFFTNVLNCSNVSIACNSMSLGPMCAGNSSYSLVSGGYYTGWQVKTIDLTPYIGTCVTFECWCNDNTFGGSYAAVAFDARCSSVQSLLLGSGLSSINVTPLPPINYCPGSGIAQISAPFGYASYTWIAPIGSPSISPSQATLATLSVTNPVANAVYTVNMMTSTNCAYTATYAIAPSQVMVSAYAVSPTCSNTSMGSATVLAGGSSVGYNYSWMNATNSVVSTASVATGLSTGIYTVTITAPSNTACGVTTSTISIPVGSPLPTYLSKPFCGTAAFLNAPGGSNFQWYANSVPISGSVATQPSLVISNAVNNAVYNLGYTNSGCRDSLIFTLQSTTPGTVNVAVSGNGCFGATGANAIINFTPTLNNTVSVSNSFSVVSYPSSIPAYSVSNSNSSLNTFSISNLTSGNSYSVSVFDGTCNSNYSFLVAPVTPSFNVSASNLSGFVCSGNSVSLGATVSTLSPSQYTYSWSPSTFLSAGTNTLQNIVVNPIAVSGSSGTIVYTVVVTPTLANCPASATCVVNFLNPPIPVINSVPALCKDVSGYTINATPSGGSFSPSVFLNGIITPSQLATGTHTFIYSISVNTCVATSMSSVTIYPNPTLSISGNNTLCAGGTSTLTVSGANNYLWSNLLTSTTIVVSPNQLTTYSVTGTNTLGNCQGNAAFTVGVIPLPILQFSGNKTICVGESATLNVSGANTYSWNTGVTGNSISISPTSSSTFVVSGTDLQTGCSGTASVTLNVNQCLAIHNHNIGSASVKIYPNPFYNELTVECSQATHLKIYNAIGMLVYTQKMEAGNHTLSTDEFSDGVYLMVVENSYGKEVLKMIKK